MSKAMLIMDMPSCCLECCLFYNEGEIQMCEGLGRIVERKNKRIRQKWCPLREVPEKRKYYKKDSVCDEMKRQGYNACIDEILGDGE